MSGYVSDLPEFGSKRFKCARCDRWWIKSKAELLAEIGNAKIEDAAVLLSRCKHVGTSSGCGAYFADADIHVASPPPLHLRYRWLGQLERAGARLQALCDGCGRRRDFSPGQMKAMRERYGQDGDIAMQELSRRLRCKCGRRGAALEWVAPASGLPAFEGRRHKDRDARGSWRLSD